MTIRRARRRDGREAISWRGRITSVQPRVHLTRSFDQRFPEYQGYVLRVVSRADKPTPGPPALKPQKRVRQKQVES